MAILPVHLSADTLIGSKFDVPEAELDHIWDQA